MSHLRVAVIGAGHLGRIHARLLSAMPDVQLAGLADPSEEARQPLAAEYGTRGVADYRDLIDDIDAAVVAAPTLCHHDIGMDLLAHRVHVLMEKPLAASLAEADKLVSAAATNRVVLQVGHVERFNPAFQAIAANLQEPKYIEARRTSGYTFRSTDIGVVLDLMIHDIDLVLALSGSDVSQVSALGLNVLGEHEDMAQARLQLNNGCVANLTASRTSLRAERTMNVFCPAAYAGVDLAARTVDLVRPSHHVATRTVEMDLFSAEEQRHISRHLFQTLLLQEPLQIPEQNPLADELRDFVTAIDEGRQPQVSGHDGRQAIAVAEMVLAAVDQHRWNGDAAGPIGPHALPGPSILRSPHWSTDPWHHRKAG